MRLTSPAAQRWLRELHSRSPGVSSPSHSRITAQHPFPTSANERRIMSANGSSAPAPTKLKILMLHGTPPYPLTLTLTADSNTPHLPPRLHAIRPTLPRQNPRPRKDSPQILPAPLPRLPHRAAQTPPPRHPRLQPLRLHRLHRRRRRRRARRLGLVAAQRRHIRIRRHRRRAGADRRDAAARRPLRGRHRLQPRRVRGGDGGVAAGARAAGGVRCRGEGRRRRRDGVPGGVCGAATSAAEVCR